MQWGSVQRCKEWKARADEESDATGLSLYVHDLKFCQFRCINGYLTAYYQSPWQMLYMWERVKLGKVQCCNVRK
ncbi:hypothetical protein ZOSMA_25G00400 [Zostera marina]|uniref:Uncharacterized protein n=1 Tax=Zostera marina TaxID=29655 RepID=A0A0K9PF27_ZOSMR|nr:hypothetical protein ZOSMA_25G00400 [Zostera marina]